MFRLACFFALALASCSASAQRLLDPEFGSLGRRLIGYDQPGTTLGEYGISVLPAAGDRIVVVSSVEVADPDPAVVGIGLARLLDGGQLDASFIGGGRTVKNAALTSVGDAALRANGDILVAGAFGNDSALVWFNADGTDHVAFAGDGGAVWDASRSSETDFPTAVADIGGTVVVGGNYDAAAGPAMQQGSYFGRIDQQSGAYTELLRGTSLGNRLVDIELRPNPPGLPLAVVLTDNDAAGVAGIVTLFEPFEGIYYSNFKLENLLDAAAGCHPGGTDPVAVDLVALGGARFAVVGNLLDGFGLPLQAFVVRFGEGAPSGRCSAPYDQLGFVTQGNAVPDASAPGALHIAGTFDGRMSYWRWAPTGGAVLNYEPDLTFNGGDLLSIDFGPGGSFGSDLAIDTRGRPILLGRATQGDANDDVALARVHASETIFFDGF